MSSGLLDGLEGVLQPGQGESYEPGEEVRYADIIGEMFEDFKDFSKGITQEKVGRFTRYPRRFGRRFGRRLRNLDDLHGQIFLDSLMRFLEQEAEPWHQYYSAPLIGSAVSALYDAGFNNLCLDMQGLCTDFRPAEAGGFVRGRKEPLRLTCVLADDDDSYGMEAGGWSSHADIRFRGVAKWVGRYSRDSEFSLDSLAISGTELGKGAEKCLFRLPEISDISLVSGTMDGPYTQGYRCDCFPAGSDEGGCVYFDGQFFKMGNRLLVPDGDGWKDIAPGPDTVVEPGFTYLGSMRVGAITR